MDKFHIGNVISRELKNKRITKREFAQMIDYSETGLYQILRKESIDTDLLLKISKVLQIPISYFFVEQQQQNSNQADTNDKDNKTKVLEGYTARIKVLDAKIFELNKTLEDKREIIEYKRLEIIELKSAVYFHFRNFIYLIENDEFIKAKRYLKYSNVILSQLKPDDIKEFLAQLSFEKDHYLLVTPGALYIEVAKEDKDLFDTPIYRLRKRSLF